MADIINLLKQISEAVYGKDVRQAIHDAIQQCYTDGKASASIASVEQTTASVDDGGENVISVILTDGTTSNFVIKNGFGVYDIPEVFFEGDITDMSKENEKVLSIAYRSESMSFDGWVKMKWQGTSSIHYDKKNFTIKMYEDEALESKLKKDFKGWGKQNKFCLKANFIDITHARNIVSARLWSQIVDTRADEDKASFMTNSPNNGVIDGFPIKLYMNGKYEGIYTWNIPKDAWMFGMDDEDPNNCVLCAEQNNNGDNSLSLGCEFRAECALDGSDWSVEVPDEATDEVKTGFNNLVSFIMNSTDEEFKNNLGNYANKQSLIDYFVFMIVFFGKDSAGKNMLMVTEDGGKTWYASMYDMDNVWGEYMGNKASATGVYPTDYQETNSLLWRRMLDCFADEIKERYYVLREKVLNVPNIFYEFERFSERISQSLLKKDQTIYALPATSWNSIDYIKSWTVSRLAYTDSYMETLGSLLDYYTINNMLTNATNSNTATTVVENGSYSATITANSGYALSSIVVTMGGVDVTADVVSSNAINIECVTGNVEITVTTVTNNSVKINLEGYNFKAYDFSDATDGEELIDEQLLANTAKHWTVKLVPDTGYGITSVTCTGGLVNTATEYTDYWLVVVGGVTVGTDVNITVETISTDFDEDGDMYSLASSITSDGTNGTAVNTGVKPNSGTPDVTIILDWQLASSAGYGKVISNAKGSNNSGSGVCAISYGNNYANVDMQYGYDFGSTAGNILTTDLERHKVAVSYDRTNGIVKIYADGALVRTVTNSSETAWLEDNENELYLLGCYNSSLGSSGCINGTIYHCDVYSRVLTTTEIVAKMSSYE